MKVKELIAKLQEFDGELDVHFLDQWGLKTLDEENVKLIEDFIVIQ